MRENVALFNVADLTYKDDHLNMYNILYIFYGVNVENNILWHLDNQKREKHDPKERYK